MNNEISRSRSIKVKPSILRKAHHSAIESQERLSEWLEKAIEERIEREEKKLK